VFGVPVLSNLRIDQRIAGGPSFLEVFIGLSRLFMVFNRVDQLIPDWLVFCTLTPEFMILPGTEGMAGYRDYGFHFRGFHIGTVLCLVSALIFAGSASLVDFTHGMI
jgi:hypothetical protein